MRREWINDSRDQVKLEVFAALGDLWTPHVIPMLSDADEWTDADRLAYRTALGLASTAPIDWRNGSAYAIAVARSEVKATNDPERDVFLDPDTGIGAKMPALTREAKYIYVAELELLAAENPDRIVVVYQHRNRLSGFPADKLDLLKHLNRFACLGGDVALIFTSRGSGRLQSLQGRLQSQGWSATAVSGIGA